jgi:hypothetical protein
LDRTKSSEWYCMRGTQSNWKTRTSPNSLMLILASFFYEFINLCEAVEFGRF